MKMAELPVRSGVLDGIPTFLPVADVTKMLDFLPSPKHLTEPSASEHIVF